MQIKIFKNHEELGNFAATEILSVIKAQEAPVIGLATGSSPIPIYKAWGEQARAANLDMKHVHGFALDEYCGIDPSHPESYHSVIAHDAVAEIGLNPDLVRVPSGLGDVDANAHEYDEAIRAAGGIHLQILGLGRNGHIGFNEPGSAFDSRTQKVKLLLDTISDNARFFDDVRDVPTSAITQGLGTILEAGKIIIVVTGKAKAPAVASAINGPETEKVPASVLRRHPDVIWCLDEEAAGLL